MDRKNMMMKNVPDLTSNLLDQLSHKDEKIAQMEKSKKELMVAMSDLQNKEVPSSKAHINSIPIEFVQQCNKSKEIMKENKI